MDVFVECRQSISLAENAVKTAGRKLPKSIKMALRALPLLGAAGSVFFQLTQTGEQLMVLVVLLWLQVYFVLELFLAGK